MLKILAILLLVILSPGLPLNAEEPEKKTISGTVVDMDWVADTISVLYSDPYTGQNDEVDIKITSDTVMHKGTETISSSDILQSDPVTVTYYDDGLSGLKAIRLSDLNLSAISH